MTRLPLGNRNLHSDKIVDIEFTSDIFVLRSFGSKNISFVNWYVHVCVRVSRCVTGSGNIQRFISMKLRKLVTPNLHAVLDMCTGNTFRFQWKSKNWKSGRANPNCVRKCVTYKLINSCNVFNHTRYITIFFVSFIMY